MTMPSTTTPHASIDPRTDVGVLSLTVADLDRSLAFYTEAIGLHLLDRQDSEATLGARTRPLLHLYEHRDAEPWPHDRFGHTGLYHFAILLPNRTELGRWLAHWLDLGFPLPGQGDHLVSEALYLSDPDGNGIEIYADRPREQWTWVNGQVAMAVDPVDIRGLLELAQQDSRPWTGMPEGTKLGHMHLQVGDIDQARAFYHDILGFDIVAHMPSALFVSAGGYHHHLGMNTWHSQGRGPAPSGTAGLRYFSINLPDEDARAAVIQRLRDAGIEVSEGDVISVHDPWHNTIVLEVGPIDSPTRVGGNEGAAR